MDGGAYGKLRRGCVFKEELPPPGPIRIPPHRVAIAQLDFAALCYAHIVFGAGIKVVVIGLDPTRLRITEVSGMVPIADIDDVRAAGALQISTNRYRSECH